MKKQKYLITGAAGFIGSSILRALVKKLADVSIIVGPTSNLWRIKDLLPHVSCYKTDLTNAKQLQLLMIKIKPTIIYHLAAHGAYPYQTQTEQIFKTNILGTYNLLESLSPIDYELFVNTGTSSEYGWKKTNMRESDILAPNSYYAISKAAQTHLVSYSAASENKPIITLRLFSVYGPYEEPTRLVPTLLNALRMGKEINMVDGTIARDMVYIDDVVDCYVHTQKLIKNTGSIFNICSGINSTVKQIVQTAVRVTGKKTVFRWGAMEKRIWDTTTWVGDPAKTKKLLGWTAQTTLTEGLSKTWNWYRKNYTIYENR